jgi:hypothetical protein
MAVPPTSSTIIYDPAPSYEDLSSLKKAIRSNPITYNTSSMITHVKHITQLTTGTEVEIEGGSPTAAIAQIGKTEIAVSLGASTNAASHNTVVFTLVYKDQDGVSHTATATGTATLADTQVAFSPAITDFYCATSFTASADFADQDVFVETTASTTVWATISATGTTTAATEAQLLGVGAIYGRGSADHEDMDAKIHYLCYVTPWDEIKFGHCTHTATSSDEIRFFEATDDGDGTTTATTTTVKDFYRILWWRTSAAATANGYFIITDADCANVNGSGGDVYGAILTGNDCYGTSRHYARNGYSTWVANIKISSWALIAADDAIIVKLYPTVKDFALTPIQFEFTGCIEYSRPIPLEPGTDFYMTVYDNAAAVDVCVEVTIVEVEDN